MKVLLVVKSKAIETLGVMYLAGVVKQAGHEAKIVDINEAVPVAKSWNPGFIGYSVMTGDQERFKELDMKLRGNLLHFTALWGGHHATFFGEDFENEEGIAWPGEGENFMAEILESPNRYPDIDSIPWPDRTDFPNMPIRDFIASRGCKWNCSYCFNGAWKKMFPELPAVRSRQVRNVVAEIDNVNPKFAYFQDSTFGISINWMREFTREYRKKANVPYHCHLRPGMVNEERALLLHDSNCVSVKIALETASNRLRKLINRGHASNEEAYIAARLLHKWGIKLIMQNIVGLPTATIEEDLETLEVNIRCKPAYSWVSIFQPYPGTELAEYCEQEKLYTGDYSEIGDNFFDKSVLNIDELHKEQVACLQRIFAFCVEMQMLPAVEDLTWERLPKFIHATMRKVGDSRMFPGIL